MKKLTFTNCRDICNRIITRHIKKYNLDKACFFKKDTTTYSPDEVVEGDKFYEIKFDCFETGMLIQIHRFLDIKYYVKVHIFSTVTTCGNEEECQSQYEDYIDECLDYCHYSELITKLNASITRATKE